MKKQMFVICKIILAKDAMQALHREKKATVVSVTNANEEAGSSRTAAIGFQIPVEDE